MNEVKAIRFTWQELSENLQTEVEAILERKINCRAKADDESYWCIGFPDGRIPMSEIYRILESLQASENERIDSLPPISEHPIGVSCIGKTDLPRKNIGYALSNTIRNAVQARNFVLVPINSAKKIRIIMLPSIR